MSFCDLAAADAGKSMRSKRRKSEINTVSDEWNRIFKYLCMIKTCTFAVHNAVADEPNLDNEKMKTACGQAVSEWSCMWNVIRMLKDRKVGC